MSGSKAVVTQPVANAHRLPASADMDRVVAAIEALVAHSPVGFFLVDREFRIRMLNPAALSGFGVAAEGALGRDFGEVSREAWHREFAASIERTVRSALEDGEPYSSLRAMELFEDGFVRVCHFDWRIARIYLDDDTPAAACYFRDASAEVIDRAVIAASEEQRRRAAIGLQAIAARARCLLWYADVEENVDGTLNWVVRMADEEAARRFLPIDIPPGYTYGMALTEARIPEDRERMLWGDRETRAGRSYRQEFRVRDARGDIRWMVEDVQIEPVVPGRWNAVGICVDITESKRAEEERERHRAEIESLNQRLQRAMAETHHRVKNNLQVVSALIDIQGMTCGSTVPAEELGRIGQHIRSLAAIHDLLTRNAVTGDTSELIHTRDIIERLAPLMRMVVGDRSITFQTTDLSLAQKQGTSLAVLINELVSNAVKHGRGDILVTLESEDGHARLTVADNGSGFSPEFDARTARNTGLELIDSVSRHDLRGSISYQNGPEGGAKVIVTFPLTREY